MTTAQADARLAEQQEELESLTASIAGADSRATELRTELGRKTKDVARLEREREREEAKAAEVKRQREAGGAGVRAHEVGRWYAASLAAYRALVGIKRASAVSKSELVLEYEAKEGEPKLHLYFDAGGRFEDAALEGVELEMGGVVEEARERNDPARLVAAVLGQLRPLEA